MPNIETLALEAEEKKAREFLGKEQAERDKTLKMLRTAMRGFLEFFDDPRVVEIMLNEDGSLWIERAGEGMMDTGRKIAPPEAERFISIVSTVTQDKINKAKPFLSGELPIWGSRIQAVIPPGSTNPIFSIRQKAKIVFPLEDYVVKGIMTEQQREVIVDAVWKRSNILVVGGTGTGKTTLTNAILQEIAKTKSRLLILEDTAELQCSYSNTVFLRQREGFTMRQMVRSSMRLRPDRIIVGEVTDGAALDLLKAWNTGHPGGVSTIHADSAQAGLIRLEQLIQEALPMPQRSLIGEAVDVIVYIERTPKSRKVKEIVQVEGFRHDEYILHAIA